MKAFALLSADAPAALIDLPDPDVAPDGLRIRVTAAGLNGLDVFEATGNLVRFMEHGAVDVDALAARGIRATNIAGDPTHDKLATLAEAVAAGTLSVPIQQTFALADTDQALTAFTAGTRGKIVLLT